MRPHAPHIPTDPYSMSRDELLTLTAIAVDGPPHMHTRVTGYLAVVDVLDVDAPTVRLFSPDGSLRDYADRLVGMGALQITAYTLYADGGVRALGTRCLL